MRVDHICAIVNDIDSLRSEIDSEYKIIVTLIPLNPGIKSRTREFPVGQFREALVYFWRRVAHAHEFNKLHPRFYHCVMLRMLSSSLFSPNVLLKEYIY